MAPGVAIPSLRLKSRLCDNETSCRSLSSRPRSRRRKQRLPLPSVVSYRCDLIVISLMWRLLFPGRTRQTSTDFTLERRFGGEDATN